MTLEKKENKIVDLDGMLKRAMRDITVAKKKMQVLERKKEAAEIKQ